MSTTTVTTTETTVLVELSNVGIQGIPGASNDPTYVTVRNATGATLTKGTIVYISGANGNNVLVSKAIATGDTTSARTLGWLVDDIANNASGLCCVEGYLEGLNTQGITAGTQLYLSGTVAGAFQTTKPVAPIHLVYVGVVTKVSAGDGHVFVKVQNGYEIGELHDVLITSPVNNQVLTYDSATDLWKNATNTPDGVTSLIASSPLTGGTVTSTGTIGLNQALLSLTKSQISDFTSGTVTSASTAQQSGTAVYSITSGTATYATTSGTAVYSTLSGTAISISGSIFKSQVSDFAAGTVTNISGTVTQAQVSGLATTLTGYAALGSANTFTTGQQTINTGAAATKGLVIQGAASQSGSLQEWQNSGSTAVASVSSAGAITATKASFAATSATVPLVVTAQIGGSTNAFEIYDQGNTRKVLVNQFGNASFSGSLNATGAFTSTSSATFSTPDTTTRAIVINGVASQRVSLLEYQNSSSVVLGGRNVNAQAWTGSTSPIISAVGGTIQSIATGANPLVTMASAHGLAVGDLVTLASTTGGTYDNTFVVATVPLTTTFTITTALTTGQAGAAGTVSIPAQKSITSRSAGTKGLVVRGATSQSANIAEFQSSAGAILTRIESTGNLVVPNNQGAISSSQFILGSQNSGGELTLVKQTSASSNPGAGLARLYFRDGTTGGTLKLVVRAGAAGAETTILDNIPQ